MNKYGERLRLRRKAKGLSQNQLAELVGCTGRSISNYERHGEVPETFIGDRIAEVLGEF